MITLRDYQQHGAQEAVRILNELGIVYFVWEVRFIIAGRNISINTLKPFFYYENRNKTKDRGNISEFAKKYNVDRKTITNIINKKYYV